MMHPSWHVESIPLHSLCSHANNRWGSFEQSGETSCEQHLISYKFSRKVADSPNVLLSYLATCRGEPTLNLKCTINEVDTDSVVVGTRN